MSITTPNKKNSVSLVIKLHNMQVIEQGRMLILVL